MSRAFTICTNSGWSRVQGRSALPTSRIAPLLDKDFATVGRIILVDDITERVQLEAQLMQADKLSSIGLLAAGVAHEVNTPLAVISSYTQMLAKQVRGDERLAAAATKSRSRPSAPRRLSTAC